MHFAMRILCFLSLLWLAACGFHPLYGHQGAAASASTTADLANINVAVIRDSPGQELRNAILDLMPPPVGSPRYTLNISTSETQIGIAIAQDATVTRQQLRTIMHAVLIDTQTQKPVWQQDLFSTSGYNVLDSQFSTLVGQEDARKRTLDDLAQRTVTMLGLFFERPVDEQIIKEPPKPITPTPIQAP